MQVPASVKPAAWGAVGGAIVMMIVGFWGFNWSTAGTAENDLRLALHHFEAQAVEDHALVECEQHVAKLDGRNRALAIVYLAEGRFLSFRADGG